jgi:NADPH:quinone reductase-like Zn-dependent oxidoreductase
VKAILANPPWPPKAGEFVDPQPTTEAEVVEVLAAALTRLDVGNAEGRHYLTPDMRPFVVGKEALVRTSKGRMWMNAQALVPPFGSMAERTLALVERGLPVPEGVSDMLAAAVGNAGLAAWLPLSWRAKLRPGETVLILGATGLSGMIAVSAARKLGAGLVIAAGRRPDALEHARAFGADATVSLAGTDLVSAFRAVTQSVDVVIDYLNGPPAEAAMGIMATGGRMVQVGSALASGIRLDAQLARRASLDVMGFAYYHAPLSEQAVAYSQLCHLAQSGEIALECASVPLEEFEQVWQRQKAGSTTRWVIRPN